MYTKNNTGKWWLYFDSVEEAGGVYREEEKELWEYLGYVGCEAVVYRLDFSDSIDHYRRQLTPEFKVRESFEVGDKVCWCGANGEVIKDPHSGVLICSFNQMGYGFTSDGRHYGWHKTPSLFHGHDVLRPEDQEYPVIYRPKKEESKQEEKLPSIQVGKCIPHWLENYQLALAGEWDKIVRSYCHLCKKYGILMAHHKVLLCDNCPIYKDTGSRHCQATPYPRTAKELKDAAAYRDMVLYLMDLQKRLEEKENLTQGPDKVPAGGMRSWITSNPKTLFVSANRLVTEIYQVIDLKGIRTPLCDSNIVYYAKRLKNILRGRPTDGT